MIIQKNRSLSVSDKYLSGGGSARETATSAPVPSANNSPKTADQARDEAVIVNIPRKVYSALDDFLYLKGSDRIESYLGLDEQEKEKYLGILSKLTQKGTIDKDKLSLDDPDMKDFIKKEIEARPYLKSLFYDSQCNAIGA